MQAGELRAVLRQVFSRQPMLIRQPLAGRGQGRLQLGRRRGVGQAYKRLLGNNLCFDGLPIKFPDLVAQLLDLDGARSSSALRG